MTDVLIVGAGPTGLMLANQLVRRGVRVRIIDRHAGPAQQTRALGVQARTLEIYAKLGIVDRALELGKIGTGANIWAQGRKMARVPLGDAGRSRDALSLHPHPRPGRQRADHGRQAARARPRGRNGTPSSSASSSRRDGVTATLKLPDGTQRRRSRAAWVGGCDGAHSARARAQRHRLSRARPTSTCSSSPTSR